MTPLRALLVAPLLGALGCGFVSNSSPVEGTGGGGGAGGEATTSAGSGASEPLPASGDVGGNNATVITWNLETFPLFDSTLDRTAALIGHLAPDVLAMQEIAQPEAFMALADALPGYAGVINDDPEAFLRLGLLYREDRVTLTDVQTLFYGDWYAFPRPPLSAHVVIEGDSPIDFEIMVVHQKAKVDMESQARRLAGNIALDEWIRSQVDLGEPDFLVLGDFNDRVLDPPTMNVFQPFVDDPALYTFLTEPLEQQGEYTFIPFQAMIDHVLVTTDMADELGTGETEVLELDKSVSSYGALSDHRPVRVWLRW